MPDHPPQLHRRLIFLDREIHLTAFQHLDRVQARVGDRQIHQAERGRQFLVPKDNATALRQQVPMLQRAEGFAEGILSQ